jgi:hypothetical protein
MVEVEGSLEVLASDGDGSNLGLGLGNWGPCDIINISLIEVIANRDSETRWEADL